MVRIAVQDTGIGIPTDEQDRLFQEFFRASNARQTTAEGTGLGLVLVKQTVERHRGTLELTSSEGEGTTIVVRLPVDWSQVRPAASLSQRRPQHAEKHRPVERLLEDAGQAQGRGSRWSGSGCRRPS